jgi:hypothetical protein
MVSAQKEAVLRETDAACDRRYKVSEGDRRHSGVTAVLVDLVRGRFNEHQLVMMSLGVAERRFDHQRMSRANRRDPDAPGFFVPGDELANSPQWSFFRITIEDTAPKKEAQENDT